MKLISLNVCNGQHAESLIAFILEQSTDTDLFCFQEMVDADSLVPGYNYRPRLMTDLKTQLPEFTAHFHPMFNGMLRDGSLTDRDLPLGQAMFIRHGIEHGPVADRFVYRTYNDVVAGDISSIPRNAEYVTLTGLPRPLNVLNFHGLWWNSSKGDNEARLEQSRQILKLLDELTGDIILVGDFNLVPGTKSLALLEDRLRNLNLEFGITDTRTSLYQKPIRAADYILVSESIAVKSLEVPDLPISDHRPMILEFDLV